MRRLFRREFWTGIFNMNRHGSQEQAQLSPKEIKEKYRNLTIKDKRKLYKCKDDYVQLKDIPTWNEYINKHPKLIKKGERLPEYDINDDLNEKISIWEGDITHLEIDAIVNAANRGLHGGGGVDGAIHSAAGHDLLQMECREIGFCNTGDAVITLGYKLPAKYVVHTVGPRGRNDEQLHSCYTTCFELMKSNNLKSIALPCVSTGIYGFPNKEAAMIAIETARQFLQTDYGQQVDRIIFCLFMPVDVKLYQKYMQMFFPIDVGAIQSLDLNKSLENEEETEPMPMSLDESQGNVNMNSDEDLELPEVPADELSSEDESPTPDKSEPETSAEKVDETQQKPDSEKGT